MLRTHLAEGGDVYTSHNQLVLIQPLPQDENPGRQQVRLTPIRLSAAQMQGITLKSNLLEDDDDDNDAQTAEVLVPVYGFQLVDLVSPLIGEYCLRCAVDDRQHAVPLYFGVGLALLNKIALLCQFLFQLASQETELARALSPAAQQRGDVQGAAEQPQRGQGSVRAAQQVVNAEEQLQQLQQL